jgi:hypothetical protein
MGKENTMSHPGDFMTALSNWRTEKLRQACKDIQHIQNTGKMIEGPYKEFSEALDNYYTYDQLGGHVRAQGRTLAQSLIEMEVIKRFAGNTF